LSEISIIKQCKRGNPKGFKALVDSYAPKLMGICLRYMKDEFEAKDVLQDSFIKIFHSISAYQNTGSFEAWLSRIAVTKCLMQLRKNKKQNFHIDYNSNNSTDIHQEAKIEIKLNEEDILEMLKELPDHYRIIFNLYVIEGYSHSEIAELLEIPESTSRTKLTRARRKMQEIYKKRSDSTGNTAKNELSEISKIS